MSSVHVPFGMGERERGGGGDDDAAVWRGENRKRAAKHGEARVELRKQLPGEREAGPGMLARLCLEV